MIVTNHYVSDIAFNKKKQNNNNNKKKKTKKQKKKKKKNILLWFCKKAYFYFKNSTLHLFEKRNPQDIDMFQIIQRAVLQGLNEINASLQNVLNGKEKCDDDIDDADDDADGQHDPYVSAMLRRRHKKNLISTIEVH